MTMTGAAQWGTTSRKSSMECGDKAGFHNHRQLEIALIIDDVQVIQLVMRCDQRGLPVTALGQFTIPDRYKHPPFAIAAFCRQSAP